MSAESARKKQPRRAASKKSRASRYSRGHNIDPAVEAAHDALLRYSSCFVTRATAKPGSRGDARAKVFTISRQTTPPKKSSRRRAVVAAVKEVAATLGNTPAVCRKSYIHPAVIEAFEAGSLLADLRPKSRSRRADSAKQGVRQAEARLMHVLKAALRTTTKKAA